MGYRPYNQEIEPSLSAVANCIEENLPILSAAALQRNISRDWTESHLDELIQIQTDLMNMHRRLSKLASENCKEDRMMRNEQVVYAWLYGNVAASGNLTTDGVKLYSYNLLIGDRSDCQVRIWDYTASGKFVSQTTSCHVGLALRCAGAPFLMDPS